MCDNWYLRHSNFFVKVHSMYKHAPLRENEWTACHCPSIGCLGSISWNRHFCINWWRFINFYLHVNSSLWKLMTVQESMWGLVNFCLWKSSDRHHLINQTKLLKNIHVYNTGITQHDLAITNIFNSSIRLTFLTQSSALIWGKTQLWGRELEIESWKSSTKVFISRNEVYIPEAGYPGIQGNPRPARSARPGDPSFPRCAHQCCWPYSMIQYKYMGSTKSGFFSGWGGFFAF